VVIDVRDVESSFSSLYISEAYSLITYINYILATVHACFSSNSCINMKLSGSSSPGELANCIALLSLGMSI
jgi:hypothetical protein